MLGRSAAASAATASAAVAPCAVAAAHPCGETPPPGVATHRRNTCSPSGGQRNRQSSASRVPNASTRQTSPSGKRRPSDTSAVLPPDSVHSTCALSASPAASRTPTATAEHARKLLAAEPADLVELVHAHVDEDAAAAGVELRRRRFAIPLVAGEEIQRAQFAIGDALTQALQRRHEAAPIRDLQLHRAARGDRRGLARLIRRDAARLLAQDRQRRPRQSASPGTRCSVLGAATSTPSSPPARSIAVDIGVHVPHRRHAAMRATAADGSATATTRTTSLADSARRCTRPMRPAPTRPRRNMRQSAVGRSTGSAAAMRRQPLPGTTRCRATHRRPRSPARARR